MASTETVESWSPSYFIANKSVCHAALNAMDVIHKIPLLNDAPLECFRDQQLVRFRGMIQDMHNPEYFFEEYEVRNTQNGESDVRCGLYTDNAHCLPHEEILIDSVKNKNSERHTCIIISEPGLNEWAKDKSLSIGGSAELDASNSNKRSLNENKNESMDCDEPSSKKCRTSDDKATEMQVVVDSDMKDQKVVSDDHILNFPIPIDNGKACIVKIYEETALKLNQVVEVIGFISLDPSLCRLHDTDETMSEAEITTHHPPTSLVPRIHAIKVTQVAKHEIPNPLEIVSKAQLIRNELHTILTQIFFGDTLAADFLICHLLSSVYMRRDFFCLGNYPLNITHFPAKHKTFPKDFYRLLSLLVKKSHLFEITIDNLNDLALLPKKDYDCNRLTSGVLQLSDHTHLVLDETELTTGQLSQAGRENYNAICDLLNFQRVTYDFKFYKLEYETDLPLLIFSELKSFIPCPTQIMLKTDPEIENLYPHVLEIAHQHFKDENRLTHIRQYLEVLKHTEFEFNEDIVKIIQEDFIQMRQTNKNISVDHLHSLMILARLMTLSYGGNSLTTDHWRKAIQMESERIERLKPKK